MFKYLSMVYCRSLVTYEKSNMDMINVKLMVLMQPLIGMGRDGEGCHVTIRGRDFPSREGFLFRKCAAVHVWTPNDDLFAVSRVPMVIVTSNSPLSTGIS